MQLSEMEIALRQTQTSFLCLENKPQEENVDVNETVDHTLNFQTNDGFNISRRMVSDAVADGSLQFIASTFDPVDNIIRPGVYGGGRKIISLAGVLGADVFPLADIMQKSLQLGAEEMRRPVEIEVACNLHDDRTATFYLLQIRPIVDSKQELNEDLLSIPDEDCILRSHNSLGHGVVEGLEDIVYVKMPDDGTLPPFPHGKPPDSILPHSCRGPRRQGNPVHKNTPHPDPHPDSGPVSAAGQPRNPFRRHRRHPGA